MARYRSRWRLSPPYLAAACAIAVAVSAAPPADGATTIGQVDPGPTSTNCFGATYWVQSATSGPSYSVPAGGGVITSWSHRANGLSGRELGLRVFRSLGGTTYKLTGTSGVQTLTPSSVNTFGARLSVQAGDVIGVYVGNPSFPVGGGAACVYTVSGSSVNYLGGFNPEPATGSDVNLYGSLPNYAPNLSATIEADGDADGYGDETQDGCPADGAVHDACPPPPKDVTAPKGTITSSSDSVKDGAVSVTVVSNEAATATATGSVNVPKNASSVYRLRRATATLKPNVKRRLKLRIPKRARRPIARAARRGRKLSAKIVIVLRDARGNRTRVRRIIALRY